MTTFDVARAIHIVAGGTALASLVVPLAARKGGAAHVRGGWIYVTAACVLAATAVVVCACRMMSGAPERVSVAAFLAFVALFSAASTVSGVRALTATRPGVRSAARGDLAGCVVVLAGALALAAHGARTGTALYVAFAIVGAARAAASLAFWRAVRGGRAARGEGLGEHVSALAASAIATVTAFLVVNASRFGLGSASFVLWFGPALVGRAAVAIWKARARVRLSASPRASASARAGASAR